MRSHSSFLEARHPLEQWVPASAVRNEEPYGALAVGAVAVGVGVEGLAENVGWQLQVGTCWN